MLGFFGGVTGFLLYLVLLYFFRATGLESLTRLEQEVNLLTFLAAILAAVVVGTLAALFPSRGVVTPAPAQGLAEDSRPPAGTPFRRRPGWRRFGWYALVVEMAVGVAAVTYAWVFILSYFSEAKSRAMGFPPDVIQVIRTRAQEAAGTGFVDPELLRGCRGVKAATAISTFYLAQDAKTLARYNEKPYSGLFAPVPRCKNIVLVWCDASLMKVFPVRLWKGSFFLAEDLRGGRNVCVLSKEAALAFFGTTDCLGKAIIFRGTKRLRVIGVTHSVKQWPQMYESKIFPGTPFVFVPMGRTERTSAYTYAKVKDRRKIEEIAASVRDDLGARFPGEKVEAYSPRARILNQTEGRSQIALAWILAGLGMLGVFIACLGVAGLTALAVAGRRREIALRMAVGATSGRILLALQGEVSLVALLGGLLGSSLTRAIAHLAGLGRYFSLPQMIFLAGLVVVGDLFAVNAAAFVPAWWGTRLAPADVLREL